MILLGRKLPAAKAAEYGLVNSVVPRDKLRPTVDAMIAELAGCAPMSVMQAKSSIEQGYGKPVTDALDLERQLYDLTLFSEDRDEGLAAFAEKRPPKYLGR